jgi:hypothetical protein
VNESAGLLDSDYRPADLLGELALDHRLGPPDRECCQEDQHAKDEDCRHDDG